MTTPLFDIIQKVPPSVEDRELYRWLYKVAETLNNGVPRLSIQGVYADNAAALAGGLVAGQLYRTATGAVVVVT